ncbi:MAG: hypothetical protein GWN62_15515 [Aliifodinibius sp.]|nr:hypothetical protein [candidate division KSB1 bacterium]NIV12630.1 hypothetical protein [Fodinibius sp.]NIR71622.1 hypothetical protein [candidate division KSB1 bacterium]NIS24850.1 hypothetical protein [candidate division KSB1 bacterium]NIU25490.1 hypothetical protein [candidate division KSB1 bacterium]
MLNPKSIFWFIVIMLISGVIGMGAVRYTSKPTLREITFEAEKYAYTPARLKVNLGDTLLIKLVSKDVTHGFYLEGYDFDAFARAQFPYFFVKKYDEESKKFDHETVQSYRLLMDKPGKFRYRCSVTCGSMHPFMQGELIVGPNYAYAATIGLSFGLMIASVLLMGSSANIKKEKVNNQKVPEVQTA